MHHLHPDKSFESCTSSCDSTDLSYDGRAWAICLSRDGQILTDSEAGYGHSIILVSSDDNSNLIVASIVGGLELCG